MRYEEHREFCVFPELQQFLLHPRAGEGVERGEGFIHEEDLRFHCHAAGDRGALFHPA
jgi:hypothetical protein